MNSGQVVAPTRKWEAQKTEDNMMRGGDGAKYAGAKTSRRSHVYSLLKPQFVWSTANDDVLFLKGLMLCPIVDVLFRNKISFS